MRAAEWEKVLATAAKTHFPTADVRHTGGPNEAGADIEIILPNPFGGTPWIVVVQVKDYEGQVGDHVVGQLRDAVNTRKERGHVIGAVLASTNAHPSRELHEAISVFEQELGVPVTVMHGDEFMKMILRGVVQYGALIVDGSTWVGPAETQLPGDQLRR